MATAAMFNYSQPMGSFSPYQSLGCPCAANALSGAGALGGYSPFGQMANFQLAQNMMMIEQLLTLMLQMMGMNPTLGGQAGGFNPGNLVNALGGPSALGGGAPGVTAPAGSSGGGGGSAGPVASAAPSGGSAPAASTSGASPVQIGSGTKVLEIGDSHTVGTFGEELDSKLRSTGAQVATYASAGASPSWFVNGTPTKYGYSERHADGSKSTTPYGQSHATPKLESLIAKEKPNVIVVNLGANFRGAGPAGIKQQVSSIGNIAKKHGIPVVWVGPPKSAKDNGNPSSLQQFDREMAAAVAPFGTYVASTPFVPKYVGSDGLHFGGSEGNQIARNWANGVFKAITGRG